MGAELEGLRTPRAGPRVDGGAESPDYVLKSTVADPSVASLPEFKAPREAKLTQVRRAGKKCREKKETVTGGVAVTAVAPWWAPWWTPWWTYTIVPFILQTYGYIAPASSPFLENLHFRRDTTLFSIVDCHRDLACCRVCTTTIRICWTTFPPIWQTTPLF